MFTIARGDRLSEQWRPTAGCASVTTVLAAAGYPGTAAAWRSNCSPAAAQLRSRAARRHQWDSGRSVGDRRRTSARCDRAWRLPRRRAAPQPGVRRARRIRRKAIPIGHRLAGARAPCRSYLKPKRSPATSTPKSAGRSIVGVRVTRPDVLRDVSARQLVRRVTGATIARVWRRAKLVVLDLSTDERVVVQPRFTGALLIDGGALADNERRYSTIEFALDDVAIAPLPRHSTTRHGVTDAAGSIRRIRGEHRDRAT